MPFERSAACLSSQVVFDGRIFRVTVDRVRTPGQRELTLDVVRHPTSVVLLPVPAPGRIIFVWQYRYAINRWIWELPAALLHESNVVRNDPDLAVGHRLIAYDAGLPKSLIRFSTLHARTASAPCPAELRARKPSPMMDLYRKKTFSTCACRW